MFVLSDAIHAFGDRKEVKTLLLFLLEWFSQTLVVQVDVPRIEGWLIYFRDILFPTALTAVTEGYQRLLHWLHHYITLCFVGVGFRPLLDKEKKSTLLRFTRSNDSQIAEIKDMTYWDFLERKWLYAYPGIFFLSAIVGPWLNFGPPPRCPQVVRCLWGEIEPFSATLAQDGLAECDQPGKSLEILHRGWELNPGHGEDRQWASPLSYHDPGIKYMLFLPLHLVRWSGLVNTHTHWLHNRRFQTG